MRSIFAELERRNVYRAAVFYAASAWLLIQVATQVFPFFNIPNWVIRLIIVAVIVGFPFAMAFSWFYEWTPEGLKREADVDRSRSVTRATGKKLLRLTSKLKRKRLRRSKQSAPRSAPSRRIPESTSSRHPARSSH